MSKVKLRFLTLASLAVLFVLALGLAFAALPAARRADAATTYSPTSVFSSGTGGEVGASEAGEGETSYLSFTMRDGGKVYYRRDLALKWYTAADETDGTLANPGVARYYSMTFAFPSVVFEKFTLTFEGSEENVTEDGITRNSIVFERVTEGVKVSVRNAYFDEEGDEQPESFTVASAAGADITLALGETGETAAGEFAVTVTVGSEAHAFETRFANIGGYFLEYRSSASSTPSTPITFEAELPEGTDSATQTVLMKALNGQTFELTDGKVQDNAAPVLVLGEKVYSFRLGQRFSLSYEAIDVCDDSVSTDRKYYMLQYDEAGAPVKPNEEDDSNYQTLLTTTYFMPSSEGDSEDETAHVSIRFDLDDGTESKTKVYLTWYAATDAGRTVVESVGEGDAKFDYFLLDREVRRPSYMGVTADETTKTNIASPEAVAAAEEYQKRLEEVAEEVSAGDGAYLYLPSLRGLVASDGTDYRNLRFSVYYYKPQGTSASSATSLRYNSLRIEVDQYGGGGGGMDDEYKFRVLVSDADSNAMQYYDEDGELVDVTSSNIWDIEGIPEFHFHVDYTGPRIEDPGVQSEGYRDQTYSVSSFDIIALDGYKAQYTLYRFDESKLPEDVNVPEYNDFVENAAKYAETYADCLDEINVFNADIAETDDEWDRTDNAYRWNPDSSLSFVPQERALYLVKVVVTDAWFVDTTEVSYQVINVRNPFDTTPGESRWLQNNILAIVLFSISAALLVAIVILFVIKPSDKTVEDVDLEKLKGGKKHGKKNEK